MNSASPANRQEPAPASAVVDIRGLVKHYGNQRVLDGCGLTAVEGEILTLLGPSGCGKTTLLRCIAGFIKPDAGSVVVDGRDLGPVPVNRRPVGVVFQSYALFPHLTVARNVSYGLRMRSLPASEISARVESALQSVSLTGLQDRYPSQLSGGQQQRVAIARVVILQPRVLLLDEPFNALDAKLRGAMQVELRQLIKRLGITAIFVTHDQDEAMTLSDRIAVMRAGRIEQIDQPLPFLTAQLRIVVKQRQSHQGARPILLLHLSDGRSPTTVESSPCRQIVTVIDFQVLCWSRTLASRVVSPRSGTQTDDGRRNKFLAGIRDVGRHEPSLGSVELGDGFLDGQPRRRAGVARVVHGGDRGVRGILIVEGRGLFLQRLIG